MPGLVAAFAEASAGLTPNPPKPWRRRMPGIHVFGAACKEEVDGRDEPGHDEKHYLIAASNSSGRSAIIM
jgi:hypothetical protein